jgi:ribosomal protein S18 acetylase RimI-like enzyme
VTESVTIVRGLRSEDVEAMTGVLARAYANSGHFFRTHLETYLTMSGVRTFVAQYDGQPAGMVVGNDYGNTAYVALMGVDPQFHRRGIGRALMDALVTWLDERGFTCAELDATPMGAPLYERYGFRDQGETHVYASGQQGVDAALSRKCTASDRASLFVCDREAFGADRSAVLGRLLDDAGNVAFVEGPADEIYGFAVAQPRAELIGPVIAADAAMAVRLIGSAHALLHGARRAAVPSENAQAAQVLMEQGFTLTRSLRHMIRGGPPVAARERVYARTNLGQG